MFEGATVRRVDEGLGLLLELPPHGGAPALTPGFAHISNLSEDKVEELGKVRYRLWYHMGYRYLFAMPGRDVVCGIACGAGRAHSASDTCRSATSSGVSQRLPCPAPIDTYPAASLPLAPLQRFRTGQKVRARVLGFRPMDGLAVLSLKPSVVESNIISLAGGGWPDWGVCGVVLGGVGGGGR